MKQVIALMAMASAGLLAVPTTTCGQNAGAPKQSNQYLVVRNRSTDFQSTHSRSGIAPQNLGRRGLHLPVVDDSIARRSALEQQNAYHRRLAGSSDPSPASAAGSDSLRQNFSERSINTAAIDQRTYRAYQAQGNGGWLGQRTEAGQPDTVQELNTRMAPRGVDTTPVEMRLERMNAARQQNLARTVDTQSLGEPNLEQIQLQRTGRGVDTRYVDEQIMHYTDTHAPGASWDNRMYGNGEPNYERLRSRSSKSGLSPTNLNHRIGRSPGASTLLTSPPRYGAGRIRRQ